MFASTKPVTTVMKEIIYFNIPYYSPETEKLTDDLKRFIKKSYSQGEVGCTNYPFIFITFFHFLISAATGAAAPGCSGTVNIAD